MQAKGKSRSTANHGHPFSSNIACRACIAAAITTFAHSALAFEVDTGNPDVKVRWDNTIKYSTAFRLNDADPTLIGPPSKNPFFTNLDDGDRNFSKGLISNRIDLLSELDVGYKHYGFRVSGAAWSDSVYQRGNANNSPGTNNNVSAPYNQFTGDTTTLMGSDAEILDAFFYGKFNLAGKNVSFKLGKHTLLYGESLFFGGNGIAAAQAGIDVIKAMAVPGSQFKEFIRPTNQLSGQIQVTPDVTLGAYYQLDRSFDRLPAAGSYFSTVDMLGAGGESLSVGPGVAFYRGADMVAPKTGQGGLELKFRSGEYDFGLYAVQWNDHGPSGIYLNPGAAVPAQFIGTYQWAFQEGIRALGGSVSTTVGNTNFAGEVSFRSNTPVASNAVLNFGTFNNNDKPGYAVGNSAHAQMSWISSFGPSFISREASMAGEIAWNRLLRVTNNPAAGVIDTFATRDATNIRVVYEPMYRQVVSGLDMSVPVGLGYGISGNSSVVPSFMGQHTGDFSVGVKGVYLGVWVFSTNYTHFIGSAGPAIDGVQATYKQALADRDFLSFSLSRTF